MELWLEQPAPEASSLAAVLLWSPNAWFKVWYGACRAVKSGGKQGPPALAMEASLNRLSAQGVFVCSQENFTIVYLFVFVRRIVSQRVPSFSN